MANGEFPPLYVFWTRRPQDREAWPLAYTRESLAEDAPHRVSVVTKVTCLERKMSDVRDDEIEKEIVDRGLTAPRVTQEMIDAAIVSETYTTLPSGKVMICELTLRNGYTVRGESAVVSKENFDEAVGRKVSRQHARDKIWELEGYLLQESLYHPQPKKTADGLAEDPGWR